MRAFISPDGMILSRLLITHVSSYLCASTSLDDCLYWNVMRLLSCCDIFIFIHFTYLADEMAGKRVDTQYR